jgi:hypothetical protein
VFPVCLYASSSLWPIPSNVEGPSRTMHLTSAIITHFTQESEHKCMYFLEKQKNMSAEYGRKTIVC